MARGNQGVCTALSCHCPHVHCLLHYTVSLFPYTVRQWVIFSLQWDSLLFCLFCIHSELQQIRKIFKLLQIFEVLLSSGKLEWLFSIKASAMLFSQERKVWWSKEPLVYSAYFAFFLIFWQSNIGGIRAFWLGTEHVFIKLKFWGCFYTITFFFNYRVRKPLLPHYSAL